MVEMDSRGTALAADGGLGRGNPGFGVVDRRVVNQLVEAAVGDYVAWLNSLHRGHALIRNAGRHVGLNHMVELFMLATRAFATASLALALAFALRGRSLLARAA